MKKNDIIILTAGENGRLVSSLIKNSRVSNQYNVIGYLDDDVDKIGRTLNGEVVLGSMNEWENFFDVHFTSPFVSSPKLNHLKHQIVNRLKIPFVKFENIIASDIKIPSTFKMNKANLILSGSEFQENIRIGSHIYISNNTVICSETEINNYVNISNSASIQGGVKIEEGAYIGANSSIIGYTKIGKWSIIGMGSVVLNDVGDFEIVAGNPARVIGVNKVAKDYFVENNLINGK